MTQRSQNPQVVVSVEEFAKMTSSQIVQLMQKNKHYFIEGNQPGVDRCICKPDYEFWYLDNWNGTKHTFKTLKVAKDQAKNEYGNTIYIYNTQGELVTTVKATQFVPA
jgi:hypothetical protein